MNTQTLVGSTLLLVLGAILGQGLPSAWAEPSAEPGTEATFYDPPRLFCRPFIVPLSGDASAIETNDTTTSLGKWVAEQEEAYELFSVDFEVGQKSTGFPVGYAHVCLSPRKL